MGTRRRAGIVTALLACLPLGCTGGEYLISTTVDTAILPIGLAVEGARYLFGVLQNQEPWFLVYPITRALIRRQIARDRVLAGLDPVTGEPKEAREAKTRAAPSPTPIAWQVHNRSHGPVTLLHRLGGSDQSKTIPPGETLTLTAKPGTYGYTLRQGERRVKGRVTLRAGKTARTVWE